MRPLSENLNLLVAMAQDQIRKPAHFLPFELPQGFAEVAAEIRRAHAAPSEDERWTYAGSMLCDAFEGLFARRIGNDRYFMLVGVLVGLVRTEAWEARNSEKRVTEETRR